MDFALVWGGSNCTGIVLLQYENQGNILSHSASTQSAWIKTVPFFSCTVDHSLNVYKEEVFWFPMGNPFQTLDLLLWLSQPESQWKTRAATRTTLGLHQWKPIHTWDAGSNINEEEGRGWIGGCKSRGIHWSVTAADGLKGNVCCRTVQSWAGEARCLCLV